MSVYVLGFQDIDRTKIMAVGGKGANLGELAKIEGLRVPDGFCVTTAAFQRMMEGAPSISGLLDQLSLLTVEDRDQIAAISGQMRRAIEAAAIPEDVREAIISVLSSYGEDHAYAVRSSATAEDLPTASFAGQQDTYLNVIGSEAILNHIRKCWASLFTERAVIYRIQHGFEHRKVRLAVVVQKLVFPQASGVVFTADPITSNRKIVAIDAAFGLGEALVSGRVNADSYKVRDGAIIDTQIAVKQLATYALKAGGTHEQALDPEQQTRPVLTDAQLLQLERLGRAVEAHFGQPQDIEWCLVDDTYAIVQSRPITTLYPIPEANDQDYHVYVSVGHQQMMTAPMKPLGLSVWQLTAARPMYTAGGRLFVDITPELASPAKRDMFVNVLGRADPLIRDALVTIIERGDVALSPPEAEQAQSAGRPNQGPPHGGFQTLHEYDPAIVADLIKRSEASLAESTRTIQMKSGPALFDAILDDFHTLRSSISDPQSFGVIMSAMNASAWVNEKIEEWLGEKNVADILSQSVPHNITSEMGLALLDVADAIRPYPEVIEYLQHAESDASLDELAQLHGGQEARAAIDTFLAKYGMRCAGEIDITRPRWSEKPITLAPIILGNIKNVEPGASVRRFEHGRQKALNKEQELLERLRALPDGEKKADETQRMIALIRGLIGYREYPKYAIVSRYFVYKRALLKEAEALVKAGVIREKEDVYYLTFEEFREAVRTHQLDDQLMSRRRDAYTRYEKLTPPRIITSDGEIVVGRYKRENLPSGALVGLAVSSGVVEGRARVLLKMEDADLEPGDIVVTAFTDPSWTPLFVSINGLVTEVGGLMTHGAVIAREYGLPAVVGVEHATRLIQDGQRIRVHGTEGYVELL